MILRILTATQILLLNATLPAIAEITIPAATAYSAPDPEALKFSPEHGISRWSDPSTQIRWYGNLQRIGKLTVKVAVRLPKDRPMQYRMTVANQTMTANAQGAGDDDVTVDFGEVEINEPGYHTFLLEATGNRRGDQGNVRALVLDGEPTIESHFNLNPRRNAASVHLAYPVEKGVEVSAFYCEMTGIEDPLWTYYMACGWHRGYFGMQVNSPTERRIIFSVWDSGNEADSRDKVEQENRVTLIDKGKDVFSGDFGNEGTGGHSHLKFPWKTGEKQRFLVTAEPVDSTSTIFSGHYFRNDLKEWMLISSWKAPKEGGYLRGLYSFSENFNGSNGNVVRKALYGNQWIRTSSGAWQELTKAKFSHDVTGKSDRLDRFMGLEGEQFFLSHGGFIRGFTEFGTAFTRKPTGHSPENMELPPLPKSSTTSPANE